MKKEIQIKLIKANVLEINPNKKYLLLLPSEKEGENNLPELEKALVKFFGEAQVLVITGSRLDEAKIISRISN